MTITKQEKDLHDLYNITSARHKVLEHVRQQCKDTSAEINQLTTELEALTLKLRRSRNLYEGLHVILAELVERAESEDHQLGVLSKLAQTTEAEPLTLGA